MHTTNHHLGEVEITQKAEDLQLQIAGDFTTIAEYSRFKFGDGEVAHKYGSMLGTLAVSGALGTSSRDQIFVTSSAYRVAPPASESLLEPFLGAAEQAAPNATLERFKISKARMATHNYAGMSFEQRSKTLQDDLILPEGLSLEGKRVVVLDDIRVTGLREAALQQLLSNAGVEHAAFCYVLDVPAGKDYPQTEAIININAVKTIDDVLQLAQQPNFVPNVRMCKFLLSRPVSEIESFLGKVPEQVARTIIHYVREDNLREVIKAMP
jgi:hypothetical protein